MKVLSILVCLLAVQFACAAHLHTEEPAAAPAPAAVEPVAADAPAPATTPAVEPASTPAKPAEEEKPAAQPE